MWRFEFCPQVRSRLRILCRDAQGMYYYLGGAISPVAPLRSKHTSGAHWLRFLMQCVAAQLQNQGLGRADQAGFIVIACFVSLSASLSLYPFVVSPPGGRYLVHSSAPHARCNGVGGHAGNCWLSYMTLEQRLLCVLASCLFRGRGWKMKSRKS